MDRLRNSTHAAVRRLLDRAKEEGSVRVDRWVEDVFLALALNETLGHSGYKDPQSASRRFLELTLAALATQPPPPGDAGEPDTVLSLRQTLGHDLAGLP